MLYSLRGPVLAKKDAFVVVGVLGLGIRVFLSERDRKSLPQSGEEVNLFCVPRVRPDGVEVYGFQEEKDLALFELLDSVSGVGPKSAINLFGIASADQIVAAIAEGRPELLAQSTGIGKKTASRIVLELREKLAAGDVDILVRDMERHADVEEALVGLGYPRRSVRAVLEQLDPAVVDSGEKIKQSLRYLKNV